MKAVFIVLKQYGFGMTPPFMERVFEDRTDAHEFAAKLQALLLPEDQPEFDSYGQVSGHNYIVVALDFQEKTT